MAQTLLRSIVAGPRARHPEANLDLCYVTDNVIATSGPSATYPQRAYRNPLPALTKFLSDKHGGEWHIFEFRAEGTGYPDHLVENRIYHFPWPDHHPPPFALVPQIMGAMRAWLHGEDAQRDGRNVELVTRDNVQVAVVDGFERVIVGHCKAGKGRTGSMSVSYLLSEEGWDKKDALDRFTARRMRPGMGLKGVSIPSQLRWIDYVERWAQRGKVYKEQSVEVCEVHVWGLRDGVKISVEGYVDKGKTIKTYHVFKRGERDDFGKTSTASTEDGQLSQDKKAKKEGEDVSNSLANVVFDMMKKGRGWASGKSPTDESADEKDVPKYNAVYRPADRIILPTSDINIATERRTKAGAGWTIVTSVAHVWFNTFFEGNGPESTSTDPDGEPTADPKKSGVFEIDWDAMDGIKGSARKGSKSFDKISVVWKTVDPEVEPAAAPRIITEPDVGSKIEGGEAADWHGKNETKQAKTNAEGEGAGKVSSEPGLRPQASDLEDESAEDLTSSIPSATQGIKDKMLGADDSDEDGVDGIRRGVGHEDGQVDEAELLAAAVKADEGADATKDSPK